MEFNIMIELIEEIMENPMLLLFTLVWFVGWFTKHHTQVKNNLIPLIVLGTASCLGIFLIEFSVSGFFVGLLVGSFQIGFYEFLKETGKIKEGK